MIRIDVVHSKCVQYSLHFQMYILRVKCRDSPYIYLSVLFGLYMVLSPLTPALYFLLDIAKHPQSKGVEHSLSALPFALSFALVSV